MQLCILPKSLWRLSLVPSNTHILEVNHTPKNNYNKKTNQKFLEINKSFWEQVQYIQLRGKKGEKFISSSRIRTSDLRMTSFTLQSSALPTELSKEPRFQL